MEIYDRIVVLCKSNGISVKRLEKELGFGNGSLAKAKSIKADRLAKISDYFKVPYAYFSGEQCLLITKEKEELSDLEIDVICKTEDERNLMKAYRKLTETNKETIVKYASFLIQSEKD